MLYLLLCSTRTCNYTQQGYWHTTQTEWKSWMKQSPPPPLFLCVYVNVGVLLFEEGEGKKEGGVRKRFFIFWGLATPSTRRIEYIFYTSNTVCVCVCECVVHIDTLTGYSLPWTEQIQFKRQSPELFCWVPSLLFLITFVVETLVGVILYCLGFFFTLFCAVARAVHLEMPFNSNDNIELYTQLESVILYKWWSNHLFFFSFSFPIVPFFFFS